MLQDIADFYQLLIDSGVPVRYTHNQVSKTLKHANSCKWLIVATEYAVVI